ncbi:hypothetical protein [Rufibacter tibetensis]|uniref:Uncharacterized protein n=1 Tax=Rufibacter tibetensis TaxID=512763 RepID=A0A0P0CTX4_9BACT|nr:hypothetical protein [Rufibacter tibetensis]ALJ00965.1 hypothetical protein DC20_20675 [Rufibacter tibetensis]
MLKQFITYFLLFTFMNTVCFVDRAPMPGEDSLMTIVTDTAADEIDSLLELVAEGYLDAGSGFLDDDLEDTSQGLKHTLVAKDYSLPPKLTFQVFAPAADVPCTAYCCSAYSRTQEVHTPPPKQLS